MGEKRERLNCITLLGSKNYFNEWNNKIEYGIIDVLYGINDKVAFKIVK